MLPRKRSPKSIRQNGSPLVDLLHELVSDLCVLEEFAKKVVVDAEISLT